MLISFFIAPSRQALPHRHPTLLYSVVDATNENGYRLAVGHIKGHRDSQEATDTAAHPKTPRVSSSELLGAGGELIIVHGCREYRLRITHSGKLILTA